MVDLLTRFPLRAKKLRDFIPWAEAVCEWHDNKRGNRWHGARDYTRLEALREAVVRAREYRDPPWSGNGFQDWCREWSEQCLRVLKPGAYLLAFGGTRTSHRMACAIEDAGFEIRDGLVWMYATGFPKSLNAALAIDKHLGHDVNPIAYVPVSDEAKAKLGHGTALKPAHEPIVMARKPFPGTVAANVLEHGTGALNVDGCRVGVSGADADKLAAGVEAIRARGGVMEGSWKNSSDLSGANPAHEGGRWPPNVLLTHSRHCGEVVVDGLPVCVEGCPVRELDEQSGERPGGGNIIKANCDTRAIYGQALFTRPREAMGDAGGASRFFPRFRFCAKASTTEREAGLSDAAQAQRDATREAEAPGANNPRNRGGLLRANTHPTVKPVELMRWLVRLVTPEGGTVLDPFNGSGSTGMACVIEGAEYVGVELSQEYADIAEQRIAACRRGKSEPLGSPKRAADERQGMLF